MRDAHQYSGTGFEDFEGSVIVRWKVLLSPKCKKKTSKCHRKQVRLGVVYIPNIPSTLFYVYCFLMISAVRNRVVRPFI